MEKVWKGDPRKCKYCAKKIFPHEHDSVAWDEKKKQAAKKAKSIEKMTGTPRKRGRPLSAKTLELLAICECE